LHHKHSFQRARGIDAITRVRSRGSWENADPFIVSNRVWTHPRRLGQGPGTKSCGTVALHHKKYQPRNAFQSQGVCSFSVLAPRHLRTRPATIRPEILDDSSRAKLTASRPHSIPQRDSIPVRSSEHIAKSVLI
jgi:hypothetical protein